MKISANISKTLRTYCEAHSEQMTDVTAGDGYSDGFAYDILLARGWCTGDMGEHTLIESNVKDMLSRLRSVQKCECSDCITGKGWGTV